MILVSFFKIFTFALHSIGSTGIKQIHTCSNKRYVLTKDSDDNVALWDVLKVSD